MKKKYKSNAYYNFFIGNDQSKWATNVNAYEEIVLKNIYNGIDIILTDDDIVYFSGRTSSNNMPTTTGAIDVTHNGGEDSFYAQLKLGSSSLTYSTYIGGPSDDLLHSMIKKSCDVYLSGET